jgi:hypothetical protein
VTVYPNPTKDVLNIEFNYLQAKDADISVADVTGRVVMRTTKSINPNEFFSLDTAGLPSGVYFVKVVTATFVQQVKFIKEY